MAHSNAPPLTTPSSSSISHFTPAIFSHSLSMRLDDGNYLLWNQYVHVAIRGHKLQCFITLNASSLMLSNVIDVVLLIPISLVRIGKINYYIFGSCLQ
ncbi:hypothetical protein PanWU01x14_326180 [Parasponia andersonii]|uniref:Retrotransposon Copia-like N-terminal domain-containing protein n=1 Tax=Parasponia andersonii TaxID=3476 RepID=A0A2P5AJM7_PARAD|nr:hypothetical protein PanWU01x14_326180 [Parasponia andersonii]